jgi:hypothetical protein
VVDHVVWMQVTAANIKAIVKVDAFNPSRKGNAGMLTIQDPNSALDGYDAPFIAEDVMNARRGIFQGDVVEVLHTALRRTHTRARVRALMIWFVCCWSSAMWQKFPGWGTCVHKTFGLCSRLAIVGERRKCRKCWRLACRGSKAPSAS